MRYFVDLAQLTLLDLLQMQEQVKIGLVNMDDTNAVRLHEQTIVREQQVYLLEKCLAASEDTFL